MTRKIRAWIAATLLTTLFIGGFALAGAIMTVEFDGVTYYGWVAAAMAAGLALAPVIGGGLLVVLFIAVIEWVDRGDW